MRLLNAEQLGELAWRKHLRLTALLTETVVTYDQFTGKPKKVRDYYCRIVKFGLQHFRLVALAMAAQTFINPSD
jgi:hypothetical protein